MDKEFYFTIDKESVAEFKDRGSRFIAYAFPVKSVEDFKKRLTSLKEEHPKAVHNCFAYRLGVDGLVFRAGDDGEPSGSAGRPILGQIDSKELTDIAIVVVRYFGGTLLGVPGLINAYKNSSSLALQTTPVVQKAVEVLYRLQFDYTLLNAVMTVIKQYNCTVLKQDMQLFCLAEISVPKNRLEEVLYKIRDLYTVDIQKI